MSDVTRILNAIERGDAKTTDELLPLVYEELRLLTAQKLSHEPFGRSRERAGCISVKVIVRSPAYSPRPQSPPKTVHARGPGCLRCSGLPACCHPERTR